MTMIVDFKNDRIGNAQLNSVRQCPYCGVASPQLAGLCAPQSPLIPRDGSPPTFWQMFGCTSCGNSLLAKGDPFERVSNPRIVEVIPAPRVAHLDLPQRARVYLDQAFQTLSAPDAAAVMAGSAVDAMLKELGYEKGSVYERIDQALADHKLTQNMAEWAHSVRLGANRPRHADADRPHITNAEAKLSVEFAEALGNFLFVLNAKIDRGIATAKQVG